MQTIIVDNKTILLEFSESPKFWRTKLLIGLTEIEIEIFSEFHNQEDVDWEHFTKFVKYISNQGFLNEIVSASQNLITEIGKAYFRKHIDLVANWNMVFNNSLYYNGKTNEINNSCQFCYTLIFNYFDTTGQNTNGDDFGLYLVDLEDAKIIAARRYQC